MRRIPRILNCAAVKMFAALDGDVKYSRTSTGSVHLKKDKIRQFAICQEQDSQKYVMYFCDQDWRILQERHYARIAVAMGEAENLFPELKNKWVDPHVAARQKDRIEQSPCCAFCGRNYDAMSDLIEGEHAYICYECIGNLYMRTHLGSVYAQRKG